MQVSFEGHASLVCGLHIAMGTVLVLHDTFPSFRVIGYIGKTCFIASLQVSRLVTSTPIKHDKENTQSSGLQISPTYLSLGETEVKRPRLKDVNAYEVCTKFILFLCFKTCVFVICSLFITRVILF